MPVGRRPNVVVLVDHERPPGMDEVEHSAATRYVTAAELPAALTDADVLLVWDFRFSGIADAWPEFGGPSWLHIASAGVDRMLCPQVVDGGVVLTNSRGVFDEPLAEYVLSLVLAFAKDLPTTLAQQPRHIWQHRETERVAGSRAVVVGAGPIGRAIAKLLGRVGIHVVLVGRSRREGPADLGLIHGSDELPDLLVDADWVVAVMPLTPETEGMFDASSFRRMSKSARFINVGRGAHVVEDDLVEALRSGWIAGAALDVFADEPLPTDSVLWETPGLLVSPHMSADTVGWLDELARVFVDNFRRWRAGEPLVNVVDKRLGYVPSSTGPSVEAR